MEPILSEKRNVVVFIPYRTRSSGEVEFFLQKRDMNAPTHAGIFSMFGGGIEESESVDEALCREVEEELVYTPKQARYFTRAERSTAIFHVFMEKVENTFENTVQVLEGEYGRFLTLSEAKEVDVSAIARLVITDISEWLALTKK